MYGDGTDYGTVIRFHCDIGYKNVGSFERRCLADRTWSGQRARCEGNIQEIYRFKGAK
jgi:hypothetical protein